MEQRRCGTSDLHLPVLGLGCWAFGGGDYWGSQNQHDVTRTVHCAADKGVNYFDTAEAYNEGRSEESLGIAIQELPREKLIIGTKVSPENTAPHAIIGHCEASLRRLGTDYIDIYMVHWPIVPYAVAHSDSDGRCDAVSDAFASLMKLQRHGKIRHIGVSNFGRAYLDEAQNTGAEIVVNELPCNLLCRAIEQEILPYCRSMGVGVIGYMALMQGLLADIYPTLDDVPLWQRRTRHFNYSRAGDLCRHKEDGAEHDTSQALVSIHDIAVDLDMTMPEIAVKWAIAVNGITCTLVGARNESELKNNVNAASRPLDADTFDLLNAVTEPLFRKLGPSIDYYEHSAHDRTRPPQFKRDPAEITGKFSKNSKEDNHAVDR